MKRTFSAKHILSYQISRLTTKFIFILGASDPIAVADTEYWLRITALLHYGGIDALSKLWEDANATGLPVDPTQLYNALDHFRYGRNNRGMIRNDLDKSQEALVFPASGQTDVSTFDVTLSSKLLLHQICSNKIKRSTPAIHLDMANPVVLHNPQNLHLGDYITFLRDARNYAMHHSKNPISKNVFNHYWAVILNVLKGINNYDVNNVRDLKHAPIGTDAKFSNAILYSKLDFLSLEIEGTKQLIVPYITQQISDSADMKKDITDMSQKVNDIKTSIGLLVQKITELDQAAQIQFNQLKIKLEEGLSLDRTTHSKLDEMSKQMEEGFKQFGQGNAAEQKPLEGKTYFPKFDYLPGAHLGVEGGYVPCPQSLKRPFAPKMPKEGLK